VVAEPAGWCTSIASIVGSKLSWGREGEMVETRKQKQNCLPLCASSSICLLGHILELLWLIFQFEKGTFANSN